MAKANKTDLVQKDVSLSGREFGEIRKNFEQLLAKLGKGYESALAYEDVLKLHPDDYDITFSAQIKRAENFDVFMEDISIIEKALNKMLKDDKNITYRDQIVVIVSSVSLFSLLC